MIKALVSLSVIGLILSGCMTTKPTAENVKTYHDSFKNVKRWYYPPTVQGYRAKEMVQYFNTVLPASFQLKYSDEPVVDPHTPKTGYIKISRMSKSKWNTGGSKVNNYVEAFSRGWWYGDMMDRSIIYLDTNECMTSNILKHEMMHSLGFYTGHVDSFHDTILKTRGCKMTKLSEIDKAALLKLYDR